MFEFEGDFFNAAYVAAIGSDSEQPHAVLIYTAGADAPFRYQFPTEQDAERKKQEAVGSWREAVK